MGGSQSREDLEKANKQLATTTQQKQQLESDLAALKAKLDEQADALQTTQNTLAVARAVLVVAALVAGAISVTASVASVALAALAVGREA